ncbi:hypothetical protein [Natrinema caseinilyticum]|uniref:hypothetical protein n=1 Tax=Natrinema caseinilyticum TaxID=2961570 RepID=UPI0020C284C5|nr:hypothetical protein [Natrinema caseinilyticum]
MQPITGLIGRDGVQTKVLSVMITAGIVAGVTFASTSTGGVVTTLTGDEEVERDGVVTLEVTIEHDGETQLGGYLLTLTDRDGDTVEQVFTVDGTPVTNVSTSEKIDARHLEPRLEISNGAALPGYERPVGAAGYEGAGAGDKVRLTITLNASAFDVGEYDARVDLVTERVDEEYTPPADTMPSDDLETDHASNEHTFRVTETEAKETAEDSTTKDAVTEEGSTVPEDNKTEDTISNDSECSVASIADDSSSERNASEEIDCPSDPAPKDDDRPEDTVTEDDAEPDKSVTEDDVKTMKIGAHVTEDDESGADSNTDAEGDESPENTTADDYAAEKPSDQEPINGANWPIVASVENATIEEVTIEDLTVTGLVIDGADDANQTTAIERSAE